MRKLRLSRLLTNIVLATLLVIQAVAITAFIAIQPVSAPVTITNWYSQPTLNKMPTGFTSPNLARDRSNATSSFIDYGLAPATALELRTFRPTGTAIRSAPLPKILSVDFKMNYAAVANTRGETYTIYFALGASANQTLLGPTGVVHAAGTDVWANQPRPGGGSWTFSDITNIRFGASISGVVSPSQSSRLDVYEGWVTVVLASNPLVYVDPPSIIDTSKVIGTTQAVTIRISNVSDFYGVGFRLRYDPKILSQVTTVLGDYYPSAPWIVSNTTDNIHGVIYIALSRQANEAALFGSGSIVVITFKVLGYGLTTLNLYDVILSNSMAITIPSSHSDGYFRNLAEPFGATLVALAPDVPQESAFTVKINITKSGGQSGAFGLYSWEFNMTYDKTVIKATNVLQGPYLLGIGPVDFQKNVPPDKGWVWANATLHSDLPGGWGNGTLAQIAFDIVNTGTSPLNFIVSKTKLTRLDYGAAVPFPSGVSQYPPFYSLPVTTVNDSVDVEFVPHDVAVTSTALESLIAYEGYDRNVDVTVMNQGGWNETFSVMAYYESGKADVDGYQADATWEGSIPWTLTGASPYLDAADYPTNYITASGTSNKAGNFTFADVPSYGKTLAGVKLYIKTWNTVDDFMYVIVNVRDPEMAVDNWVQIVVTPTSHVAGGDYVIVDLFADIYTWTRFNNTKVRLQKVTLLGTDTVGIDHMYLVTESQIGTTQAVTNLPFGNSQVLTFTWNTTGVAYGDYEVFGRATTVFGETDVINNIMSGGICRLTTPGDVNADKTVDVFDILKLKFHRSGPPPGPGGYNIDVDINNDTFIDVFDILIAKAHLGESW